MADDTKEKMLRQVQFMALHYIVEMLLAREFKLSADAKEMAAEWLNFTELHSEGMTFPDEPPELSDIAAQEYRDSAIRIVLRARALATGEPHDPNAYRRNWRLNPGSSL